MLISRHIERRRTGEVRHDCGFTLVELLIVVVVLVTLMTITFRLSTIGGDSRKRNSTIARMNRIENCLSGYYAAFGSYPPVALHGSRNIYAKVNSHGIQSDSEENENIWGWTSIGEKNELEAWEQVKAACRSQPVDCRYPYPSEGGYNQLVRSISDSLKKRSTESKYNLSDKKKKIFSTPFDNGVTDNVGRHNAKKNSSDWRQIQLFKFGLMSYLLPRYMVMMNSREELYRGGYAQWESNNSLPCDPMTGTRFNGWQVIREKSRSTQASDLAKVANIPSQAVTARWMPNLEGLVCCNHDYKLFGINIRGDSGASELRPDNFSIEVYSPGGYESDSTSGQYVLDSATVLDGWWHEFYYYSPAPYQSYTLWSGGVNDRTFPPWVPRQNLDSKANKCISEWVKDDIVRLSN